MCCDVVGCDEMVFEIWVQIRKGGAGVGEISVAAVAGWGKFVGAKKGEAGATRIEGGVDVEEVVTLFVVVSKKNFRYFDWSTKTWRLVTDLLCRIRINYPSLVVAPAVYLHQRAVFIDVADVEQFIEFESILSAQGEVRFHVV